MAHRGAEVVRELLARGAALNAQDDDGHTPLIDACSTGQLAVATLLLDAGADLALLDNVGSSALRCAEIRVELDDAEPAEGNEPRQVGDGRAAASRWRETPPRCRAPRSTGEIQIKASSNAKRSVGSRTSAREGLASS